MNDYLLIYELNYDGAYDGCEYLVFKSQSELENKINDIHREHGEDFVIKMAARLREILVVEPVQVVTQYRIKD